MGKLFGTDGIRGVVGENLDALLAFRVGRAAAEVLTEEIGHKPRVMIGKDTRISCDLLEAALTAGLCASGADVVHLGVLPTPAVAFLTVHEGFDAGIVVSASHNPYEHNGIKIFNAQGYKLPDEAEEKIEAKIISDRFSPYKTGSDVGKVINFGDLTQKYIDYLVSSVKTDLTGLKIAVDCANGASSVTAKRLFESLNIEADIFADRPSGININDKCGSTHLESLSDKVKSGGYDAGIAFDGDADRCLVLDETGAVVDGDRIMGIIGLDKKKNGTLLHNTIVATVMSNLGFHVFAEENGIKLVTAAVGDRYVLEEMLKNGYTLGGEQSGHLIFRELSTTGDGQLTALQFLSVLKGSGKRVSELTKKIPQYPQTLLNIKTKPEEKNRLAEHPVVKDAIEEAGAMLGGRGRILVRPSGTEPLVRVMVEGPESEMVDNAARLIAEAVAKATE